MKSVGDCSKRRCPIALNIDATVIASHQKEAKYTYKKHPGSIPIVDYIAEAGQVVATEL